MRDGKGKMRAGGGVNAEKRKISAKRFTGFARNSSFSAEREEAYFSLAFFAYFLGQCQKVGGVRGNAPF
jgi:hypothetical protein